jgi:hypothetical protein
MGASSEDWGDLQDRLLFLSRMARFAAQGITLSFLKSGDRNGMGLFDRVYAAGIRSCRPWPDAATTVWGMA